MDDISETNLTEKMLVRQLTSLETSLISNSCKTIEQPAVNESLVSPGAYSPKWFRLRRKAYWFLQGLPMDIWENALIAISSSKNKRSRENLLDTVEAYGEGNWCYEFVHQGTLLVNKAKALEKTPSNKEEYIRLLNSARICFNVASYPHLRGDKNADKAQTIALQSYRDMLTALGVKFKELSVPCSNGNKTPIKAWLHLPKSDEPVPMIIAAGSYETLFSDFFLLFAECLAPHGVAMLTLDNPRCGQNQTFALDYDCSILHREVLDYVVQNEPLIDSTRIGALGVRFGGNIVTRMCYMRSQYIKAAICLGPAINRCFTDDKVLDELPVVVKNSIANRIDRDVADWNSLKPILSQFSLKVQGLLGSKTAVPISAIGFDGDSFCDSDDLKLLANSSVDGEFTVIKKGKLIDASNKFYEKIISWYGKYFNF
jgi:esterase FrsA